MKSPNYKIRFSTQLVFFFIGIFLIGLITVSCSKNNVPASQPPPVPPANPEPTITNNVENSISPNTATDKVETAAEQQLLAVFPQLSWSRAKLEFRFIEKAEMYSELAAGANSDDETLKWATKKNEVFTKSDDTKIYTEGWKMSGRIHESPINFSKPDYTLSGITGEIKLLFDGDKLIEFSFWTDGSDADFAKLYQVLVGACGSSGDRMVNSKDDSQINWVVLGGANRYEIIFSHKVWRLPDSVEVERGMSIFIK